MLILLFFTTFEPGESVLRPLPSAHPPLQGLVPHVLRRDVWQTHLDDDWELELELLDSSAADEEDVDEELLDVELEVELEVGESALDGSEDEDANSALAEEVEAALCNWKTQKKQPTSISQPPYPSSRTRHRDSPPRKSHPNSLNPLP
jgi:hypothetical protein